MMVNKKDTGDDQLNVPLFARKNVRSQMGTRTRINRIVAQNMISKQSSLKGVKTMGQNTPN
jgi:hypothetical protein